jgi:DNA-binding Lrp family transcriptional regulator
MTVDLDEIDRALLDHLQGDARLSTAELGRRLELSATAIQKRLRKLEENGVIAGYALLVDREALGYDMLCLVQVTLRRHEPQAIASFRAQVKEMAEVLACYHVTGEYDYLLKVIVHNRKHLERFLVETLTPMPGMDKIRTSLVLSAIKESTALPVWEKSDE